MSPSGGGFGSASESEDENTEGAVCSPRGFRTSFFLRFGGGEAIVIEEIERRCGWIQRGEAMGEGRRLFRGLE